MRDTHHGTPYDLHIVRLEIKVFGRLNHSRHQCARDAVLGAKNQAGLVLDTVGGQHSSRLRQLQHGECVVTLADAKRNRLAGVPFLLLRLFVVVALPLLVGQHTAHFAIDVDAGDLAEAQRHHEVIDGFYAQLIGQGVVIHIAGFNDALVHVHRPQR